MPERSPQDLWEAALGQLELHVTRPNFDTWLRHTVGLRKENERFVVGVPSDFALEWLKSRMDAPISRVVSDLLGTPTPVSFEILGLHGAADGDSKNGRRAPTTATSPGPRLSLDPRLTFESFTVVDSNRFAFRAARRVATVGAEYNPLVLCASPGLGKTHLLQAIAHYASRAGRRVILHTGEEFVTSYANAVRAGEPHTFRNAYDNISLFILDDLQFLASRSGSQEQFFHIFNTLQSQQRLVVIAIDQPLSTLSGLSAHLRSRLEAGLTVELKSPSHDEQVAILRAKAAHYSPPISEEILKLILRQPLKHISALEGALNRAAAFLQLGDSSPPLELVEKALHPFDANPGPPDSQSILEAVSTRFHVSSTDLAGPSRARDITYARHIAMYLLRTLAQRPLAEIGQLLGGRDHTTVLSGYRRINRETKALPSTLADIENLHVALRYPPVA